MMQQSIYQALAELETARQAAALCIVVRARGSTPRGSTSKMLVYPDGRILGTVGGGEMESRVIREALAALQDGKTRLLAYNMTDPARGDPGVCGGQVEVFVEPILPPPALLVLGGGHVGKAVVRLAKSLGFYVILADDRPEFCTPESVPGADEYLPVPLGEVTAHAQVTPYTWVVLTTRGVAADEQALPPLLSTPAAYIGVIGSRRRWKMTCDRLRALGVPEEQMARVRSPIGLEIGAETPEEIAVSILAEIIMLRNGGDGRPMAGAAAGA